MSTDAVLIGSILCVVGTVAVLGFFVYRGIQQMNHDAEMHKDPSHH